jgi:hypothetical protein
MGRIFSRIIEVEIEMGDLTDVIDRHLVPVTVL